MENQKRYCVSCKKEVTSETEKCKCGGRYFAYGDLKIDGDKILCKCGNESFKWAAHMDYTHKAVTTMTCTKCGNVCGTEHYRDEKERMLWED